MTLLERPSLEIELEVIALEIEDVVDDTLRALAPIAAAKGLAFNIEWGECVPRLVLGDPLALRRCLTSLVDNAIKFTEKGAVHVRVRSAEAEDGLRRIRFEVEDSGVGIGTGQAERLFESRGGMGLGLPIVQRLARLMGGSVGWRSCPDVGSLFHFDVLLKSLDARSDTDEDGWRGVFIVAHDSKEAAQWSTCFRRAGALICGTVGDVDLIPVGKLSPTTILVAAGELRPPRVGVPVVRVAPVGRNVPDFLSNPLRMGELRAILRQK